MQVEEEEVRFYSPSASITSEDLRVREAVCRDDEGIRASSPTLKSSDFSKHTFPLPIRLGWPCPPTGPGHHAIPVPTQPTPVSKSLYWHSLSPARTLTDTAADCHCHPCLAED